MIVNNDKNESRHTKNPTLISCNNNIKVRYSEMKMMQQMENDTQKHVPMYSSKHELIMSKDILKLFKSFVQSRDNEEVGKFVI